MIGFDMGFDSFSVMFTLIFLIVILTFVVNIVSNLREWSNNNKQPILDVDCKVISKRVNVVSHAGHTDANGYHHHGSSSTSYYITFQFESGDRLEFEVNGKDYGVIVENDYGVLKFQGSRFLGFSRYLK